MSSPLRVSAPGWVAEFKAFIMRGNVVDLAMVFDGLDLSRFD